MLLTLGDVIADLAMRIPAFPVNAQDLKPISYLEIGPGGATNIAIMAARFGLSVGCLGEVGDDTFGKIILDGLEREGIDTTRLVIGTQSKTPVAGVLVDAQREPAYLGYTGELKLRELTPAWRAAIVGADALFADGWIEITEMPQMILDAFRLAREHRVPTFFDPGPGNPAFDDHWQTEAANLSTVLLLNEDEAKRLTGLDNGDYAAHTLLARGAGMVVLKRGAKGIALIAGDGMVEAPGFTVEALDLTGAGDSVTGAVLFGYLKKMTLSALGQLANATGAAKVQKLGTGHNMPTLDEIRAVLDRFVPGHDVL